MLDNHHHLYNKDTHSSYFWWCCHGPIACPVNKESYYTAVNVSLCFVMFTRHKLSMTMRQFILLELSTVHPSPIQQIANNSNFSQRNPKRWHSFYSGTNEVKHKKATSHCSGIVVFFYLEIQSGYTSNFQKCSKLLFSTTTKTEYSTQILSFLISYSQVLALNYKRKEKKKKKSWAAKIFSSGTSWVVWEWHQCSPG